MNGTGKKCASPLVRDAKACTTSNGFDAELRVSEPSNETKHARGLRTPRELERDLLDRSSPTYADRDRSIRQSGFEETCASGSHCPARYQTLDAIRSVELTETDTRG